jgi:hypothetical protein
MHAWEFALLCGGFIRSMSHGHLYGSVPCLHQLCIQLHTCARHPSHKEPQLSGLTVHPWAVVKQLVELPQFVAPRGLDAVHVNGLTLEGGQESQPIVIPRTAQHRTVQVQLAALGSWAAWRHCCE